MNAEVVRKPKLNQEDISFFVYVSLKNFWQRFISIVLHFQLIAQEQI